VIASLFAAAEVDGWLHAVDLATGAEVSHRADEPVVLASVFKSPGLLELYRQDAAGELDASSLVTIPSDGRTLGPFGISVMRDPITMSWRDLAWLMIGISDNAATDVICDRVGIEKVNALVRSLGLDNTVLVGACRDLFASIADDLELDELVELDYSDVAAMDALRAVDPVQTSHTTARDATALLVKIWADEAAPATACAQVRDVLGLQVWPHRLAAGFPEDGVKVSGKTGTLARWRNEVGVVEFPDGRSYAVAVFTRSHELTVKHYAADAVIGQAARAAIEELAG
jgi:beta-lactamase class A